MREKLKAIHEGSQLRDGELRLDQTGGAKQLDSQIVLDMNSEILLPIQVEQ